GIVDAFPLPNGPDLFSGLSQLTVNTAKPSSLNAFSLRVDHALTSRLALFASVNHSPSSTQSGYSNVTDLHFSSDRATLGLPASHAGWLATSRFNLTRTGVESQWQAPLDIAALPLPFPVGSADGFYRISISGLGQLLSGRDGRNRERQLEFAQSLELTHG